MNARELEMVEILSRGKDFYNVLATKAEFEAEGTRVDELLRLIDIANKAKVDIALKIGGCEAIRDLLEAKQFGVKYIIAPMVETPYALKKYIQAKNKVFNYNQISDVDFLFNLETYTSYKNSDELIKIASQDCGCHGVVFGRVDFVGSMNLNRSNIEDKEITNCGEVIAKKCLSHNLDFVVGGAISINAVNTLKKLKAIHLNRFETRKIIFDSKGLNNQDLSKALIDAVHFELLWLLNKRDYYGFIYREDDKRIEMLENRWNILSSK